jgi:hypothetical protein
MKVVGLVSMSLYIVIGMELRMNAGHGRKNVQAVSSVYGGNI